MIHGDHPWTTKICGFLNRYQVLTWNLCFRTCNGAHSNMMFLLKSELAFDILKQHLAGVAGMPGCSTTSMHYLFYYTTILIRNYSLCEPFPTSGLETTCKYRDYIPLATDWCSLKANLVAFKQNEKGQSDSYSGISHGEIYPPWTHEQNWLHFSTQETRKENFLK